MGQAFGTKLMYTKLESSCQSRVPSGGECAYFFMYSRPTPDALWDSSWDDPSGGPALHLLCVV